MFVSVQHPGEGGSYNEPQSLFPDYVSDGRKAKKGQMRGPRPTVVQVYRRTKAIKGQGRGPGK